MAHPDPADARTVTIGVQVLHETDDAWLVNDHTRSAWVPKSCCDLHSDGLTGDLTLPEWLALEKGLI